MPAGGKFLGVAFDANHGAFEDGLGADSLKLLKKRAAGFSDRTPGGLSGLKNFW